MNNVSQISKAKRLTEEEVHAAAKELQESGVKVSSIEVYKHLGRGSLTTITNFLRSWNQEEKVTTLPSVIMLPETLKKSAEQLIIKVWSESQALAEQEINSQREALRQAEAVTSEKIAEAEAFSEEQAKQIEALEAKIEILKKEKANDHEFFLKEEKRMHADIAHAKKSEGILEQRIFETEKQLKKANTELAEQQQLNEAITKENIELKYHGKAIEQKLIEIKQLELKASKFETENYNLKQRVAEEEKRSERNLKDNERLREKAAMLEGELLAWKNIKAEEASTTRR